MIEPKVPEDRVPPMTPQLALRVAIVGSCALAVFAIIFFRLWYLQVLSGSQYRNAASVNAERPVPIQPARGEILDADGNVLVGSNPVPAVELSAPDLPVPITEASMAADADRPPAKDARLYDALAQVLRMPTTRQLCIVDGKERPPHGTLATKQDHLMLSPIGCLVAQGVASVPYDDITIDTDVSSYVHAYLAERASAFRGVVVQKEYLTTYPLNTIAAQLLGTVGPISCNNDKVAADCELKWKHFKGVPETMTAVGQSGLEYEYDQYLRGTEGTQSIKVNATGQFEGLGTTTRATAGENLQVSINTRLQEVGQNALRTSIEDNAGSGGAFVAMDPQNGQVYAMGSYPTFNPNVFTHHLTQAQYNAKFGPNSGDPQFNRAIDSAGPTGSTFKVITATAALESGSWLIGDTYTDNGQFCFAGTTECLHNAGHVANGTLNLVSAIRVSDDVFFYNLGDLMNNPAAQGGALQAWAKRFGIGRNTGIDLPASATGTRPTPAWRAAINALESRCMAAHKDDVAKCPYAAWPTETWTVGDNVNMAVGQGDVQVSPLQLAVVYAALANGGRIVTPHLGEDIQSSTGTILQRIDPGPQRKLDINPTYLQTILQGLREAASAPGGTSADVMGDFPEPVYGKTGTAEYNGQPDYAWYACFVPATATSKPIVVVAWVERGGFGDVAAAPVARQILSQWFLGTPGPYKSGTSNTL